MVARHVAAPKAESRGNVLSGSDEEDDYLLKANLLQHVSKLTKETPRALEPRAPTAPRLAFAYSSGSIGLLRPKSSTIRLQYSKISSSIRDAVDECRYGGRKVRKQPNYPHAPFCCARRSLQCPAQSHNPCQRAACSTPTPTSTTGTAPNPKCARQPG